MGSEELIRKLDENFSLAVRQEKVSYGKGYKLHLSAKWNPIGCNVQCYHVLLSGTNPLTGENVESEGIRATFSFDNKEYQSKNILKHHGRFYLKCSAVINNEEIFFRNKPLELDFPENKPEIMYSVKEVQGFRFVELKSNCWGNCKGKVWIRVDGHDQQIDLPADKDRTVRFYLPAIGNFKISVQDDNVILEKGR